VTDPATQRRVEQTCEKLLRDGAAVTFTTVAAAAGVSRTTLYRDENLRAVVEEHRSHSHDPRTLSGLTTEVAHLRTAVEALADRVRQHDEQLRRLTARRKAN
jgi:AcrR family transcriptional regulator